jgi:hypothetical protein
VPVAFVQGHAPETLFGGVTSSGLGGKQTNSKARREELASAGEHFRIVFLLSVIAHRFCETVGKIGSDVKASERILSAYRIGT